MKKLIISRLSVSIIIVFVFGGCSRTRFIPVSIKNTHQISMLAEVDYRLVGSKLTKVSIDGKKLKSKHYRVYLVPGKHLFECKQLVVSKHNKDMYKKGFVLTDRFTFLPSHVKYSEDLKHKIIIKSPISHHEKVNRSIEANLKAGKRYKLYDIFQVTHEATCMSKYCDKFISYNGCVENCPTWQQLHPQEPFP